MKSIGETLREARELKGVSIKLISQEINISKEYLEALEEEQFDIFPAETYLLGFLRNYSEYLGLDTDKTVTLYKNYKISEEPAPLEELVGQKNSVSIPVRPLLFGLFIIVIGVGGWFLVSHVLANRPAPKPQEAVRKVEQYRLDESSAQWNLLTGDEILISYESGELRMVVAVEESKLKIQPAGGGSELVLAVGDEKILPGGDGIPVIGFRLRSVDESGALLQVERTDVSVASKEEAQEAPVALPKNSGEPVVLLAGKDEIEDFTLNALFSGYCLFRYEIDGGEAVEKFYRDGDRIRTDARESVSIGYSSAGDVSIKISGEPLESGKSGEVAVRVIQWVKNDEGKYDLVLFPVQ